MRRRRAMDLRRRRPHGEPRPPRPPGGTPRVAVLRMGSMRVRSVSKYRVRAAALPPQAVLGGMLEGALGSARGGRRGPLRLSIGLGPDSPVVHEPDLPADDLLAVLLVLHGLALEVEVLGVDRLLVDDLVELG